MTRQAQAGSEGARPPWQQGARGGDSMLDTAMQDFKLQLPESREHEHPSADGFQGSLLLACGIFGEMLGQPDLCELQTSEWFYKIPVAICKCFLDLVGGLIQIC